MPGCTPRLAKIMKLLARLRSYSHFMNNPKQTARIAGLLWLLTAITAGFSLIYVRPRINVPGDALATANNIIALESLFRIGIAAMVLSQVFTLFFGLAIFRLFKDANRTLAMVFLTSLLVAVGLGVANSLNNIGALSVLTNPDYMKAFAADQLVMLAMIFLRLNNSGIGLVEIFTAIYLFTLGLLIIKTRYIPRVLGVFLMIGACAFTVNTFTKILVPQFYPATLTQITMLLNALGAPLTILWLLIKGVKVPQEVDKPARE